MSILGSLGHHFGQDLAKVGQRVSQGAEKGAAAPPFWTLFGTPGEAFGVTIFACFLSTLPERLFVDLGAQKACKREAFGGHVVTFFENTKTLIFETPHAV